MMTIVLGVGAVLVLGAALVGVGLGLRHMAQDEVAPASPREPATADGTVMLFAVDLDTRNRIAPGLDDLLRSPANLAKSKRQLAVRTIVKALLAETPHWQLVGGWNAPLGSERDAADVLARWLGELRSRDFVLRATGGGKGLCLVALVVCARVELLDLDTRPRSVDQGPFRSGRGLTPARAMHEALQGVARLGRDDLVAYDLLWTPSDEGESVQSDTLMRAYPELVRAD